MAKDVTHLIERLEVFEERAGVRLEAMSAFLDVSNSDESTFRITVRGEIHPRNGTTLSNGVELSLAVYDAAARVVETDSAFYDADTFFGFEAFEMACFYVPLDKLSRLRLIPKL